MRIEKVYLENVKSYGNGLTEISLAPGVNAVLGENGAGKSTVLEAVGYALFDYLSPYTQDDFLRNGADEGRVRVEVRSADHTFTVERCVGSSTYRILQDGGEVAVQKQNVIPWIRDEFGVPEPLDLSTLWNACVGVPQGKLTMDFTGPPKERRRSFDPILQTAAYTEVWEDMRDVEKEIEDEIAEAEREIEGLKAAADGLEEKVVEKESLEESLQDLKSSKSEAEEELSGLREEKDRLESAKKSVEQLRAKLEKEQSKIESARASLDDARALQDEAEEAMQILENVREQHQEYERKEEERKSLEKELERMEDVESKLSGLAERLAQLREREKSLRDAAATAQEAKEKMSDLREKVSKQEGLEEKLSELMAEVKRLSESISLLRDVEEAECPTCNQLLPEDQREKVLDSHREVKSELEGRILDLENKLEDLGSPKRELEEAKTRYRDNKQAEEKLPEMEKEIERLEARKEELESSLDGYEDLRGKIDTLNERLSELEGAHERYVRNEALASKLREREKKVEEVQERIEELQERKEETESGLGEAEEQFDEDRYQEVSSRVESLSSEVSELGARIEEREDNLERVEDEIERKRDAKKSFEEREKDKRNLEKGLEFASFVREGIHDAQPLVTEILVQKISETASKIFRQLRGGTQSLEWMRDYQIVVRDGGEERAFHKLSGGEQVCAALAVRLAVLQRLAPVSFAFLDEPTENLDGERRENLASQLERFEALDQLCVISHDRVFESMADQVVSLEKRDGTTRTSSF